MSGGLDATANGFQLMNQGLKQRCESDCTPEQVWAVLTDFAAHPVQPHSVGRAAEAAAAQDSSRSLGFDGCREAGWPVISRMKGFHEPLTRVATASRDHASASRRADVHPCWVLVGMKVWISAPRCPRPEFGSSPNQTAAA